MILREFLPDRRYFLGLLRGWKLASFGAGMLWLFYGAVNYSISDWDVGISIIMGVLTYIFAPWSVITIHHVLKYRPHGWLLQLVAAFVPAMFSVDWSYLCAVPWKCSKWGALKM